jgi:predicted alpha/beta hydrolase family esterase
VKGCNGGVTHIIFVVGHGCGCGLVLRWAEASSSRVMAVGGSGAVSLAAEDVGSSETDRGRALGELRVQSCG